MALSTSLTGGERPTRLMISRMELEQFKSYAGVQSIGPFHKSFSSIVGPNGSGKSNVIDALLFVFGKRAKQLRLNKVSELIHKSSSYPNLDYARVSVYFQLIWDDENSDDAFEVVPNSEFVVSRTAYLNNSSKYTVDGRSSTFTDVGLLLRRHGVDLDNNRFLILQGEVEQIAMMKPKAQGPHEEGLLEYLEDIIGSNVFVEPIEEKAKALEAINEQRAEKVHRLKIAEKERDNLQDAKLEAESFLDKERQLRRQKNKLFQLYERAADKKVSEMTAKHTAVSEKLQEEKLKMTETETLLRTIEATYQEVKKDHSNVEAELQKFTAQYDAFERRDVKLQEDMKHCKAAIKKQAAIVTRESKKQAELEEEAKKAAAQAEKYRSTIADFEANKVSEEAELQSIMDSLQEGTADLRRQLEGSQLRLAEAEKAASSFQAEKDLVSNARDLLCSRSQKAIEALEQLRTRIAVHEEESRRDAEELSVVERYETEVFQPRHAEYQKQIASLETEEANTTRQIRELMAEVETLKESFANQQKMGSANKVVAAILQAARPGGLLSDAGVRGRLGDLASIDAEFDVAVTTACRSLDFVVVETSAGAQRCVEFLRSRNVGRASFIILEQMREWESGAARPFTTPNGAKRLFDLLNNVDDELVRAAFYFALRDTLVASDLDAAVNIAYVGDRAVHRVVTKDGQLIDTSGAMSGGGNEVRRGGMKLSSGRTQKGSKSSKQEAEVTPEMIRAAESKLAQAQQEVTALRQQRTRIENDIKDLSAALKTSNTRLQKLRMATKRSEEQFAEMNSRINQLSQESQMTSKEQQEHESYTARLEELEGQISDVSPNLRALQLEVASLQRQILSFGGPRLAKCQARVDSLQSQLEMLATNLSTKIVEEATTVKNAAKAATAKDKAIAESAKNEERLNSLLAEQKEMEEDALRAVEAVEIAKANLALLAERLAERTTEYDAARNALSSARTAEVDLAVEVERLAGELKEHTSSRFHWHREAENIRKQHRDEAIEFAATLRSAVSSIPGIENDVETPANEDAMDIEPPIVDPVETPAVEELSVYSDEELEHFAVDELKRDINLLEAEHNKLRGNVNMNALLDYLRKDTLYKLRLTELESINATRNAIRDEHEELRRRRLEAFMAGFGSISLRLKEMYQMITLGGDAELELLDSLDPFSEGISFSVRPPKKSWKQIGNLSGGEKTLSSLALVFALHYYKPTPLYVMDEIDAALDFKNVSIVANYIKERTKNAQFIIISLRNNMFELADRLVGIYKTSDTTKSVTINPKLFHTAPAHLDGPVR